MTPSSSSICLPGSAHRLARTLAIVNTSPVDFKCEENHGALVKLTKVTKL